MQTFWMDTHCMDTYWWDTCWTDTYWWDTYWWDTFWMDMCGICVVWWICVGYVWCEICVGYVWCEIRQQSSEEPCDETSFGKNDDFWRDSTIPVQISRVYVAFDYWLFAWPSNQWETDAHHGYLSLRFPMIPLPQTNYIALVNTSSDIDNTGYIALIVGCERTRWKSATALSGRWLWLILLSSHSVDKGYSYLSWLALGLGSTYVYRYQGALLLVELSQRHPRGIFCSSPERAASPQLTLTLGQPKAFRQHLPEADIPWALAPSDLQAKTAHVHTAGRCCLYRAVVWIGISIRWALYSLLTYHDCGVLLVEMAVWVREDMMHELGTPWSGSRSGFPLHKGCASPAPGLRPGAKQRAQRVCNRRVNSSHLVSKVQRGVTSILGDWDAKDNQCQQETEWLKSLIVASRWQAWLQEESD